jgi:hypothetical protein
METAPIYTRSESLFTGIFVPFQAHRLNSTIDPIRLLAFDFRLLPFNFHITFQARRLMLNMTH